MVVSLHLILRASICSTFFVYSGSGVNIYRWIVRYCGGQKSSDDLFILLFLVELFAEMVNKWVE